MEQGGHLASVNSLEEQQEVEMVVKEDGEDIPGVGLWLGGSDMVEEGVWQWTDKTPWGNFTHWAKDEPREDLAGGVKTKGGDNFKWEVGSRAYPRQFVCRFERSVVNTSSFQLSKKELGHSLNFWLSPSQKSLEEMVGREKMPSLNISWEVEMEERSRSSLHLETKEVGRKVESPQFGELGYKTWVKTSEHLAKVSLVTGTLAESMRDGETLVVEIASDLGQGELVVGQGSSFPGQLLPKGHLQLYVGLQLNWAAAESFCVTAGGHLASVHSEQELAELVEMMAEQVMVVVTVPIFTIKKFSDPGWGAKEIWGDYQIQI